MGSRWRGGWRRWPWQATIEGHARLLCDRRQLPSGLAILDSVSFRRIQALRLCTDLSEQPANIRVTQRRSALPAVASILFSVSPTHPGSEDLTNGRSISGVCAAGRCRAGFRGHIRVSLEIMGQKKLGGDCKAFAPPRSVPTSRSLGHWGRFPLSSAYPQPMHSPQVDCQTHQVPLCGHLLDAPKAESSKAQDILDPSHHRLGDPFAAPVHRASL